ncbi:hypothetical protein EV363DRAFT_1392579 [Boletus edulis]|uniref:Uncharacterized protein n=1 Tax=Boletus edulis BED1 TaxID=1328754 RepID=A0AAD4GF43_BOLED|nr:hypothetical protein EV363DRAFT_1392579 [Boletus edulis]KAF8439320.1 hypothetical protein L210DRAFT_949071 [Boletus edulis BED1]
MTCGRQMQHTVNKPHHSKAELVSHANLSRQCSFPGEVQSWRRTVQGPPCVGYTSPEVPLFGIEDEGNICMHETEIRTWKMNTLLQHSGKRDWGQRTQLRFPATSRWA